MIKRIIKNLKENLLFFLSVFLLSVSIILHIINPIFFNYLFVLLPLVFFIAVSSIKFIK
jgi:hypothetical protein